jgi:hypothetical protein
MCVRACVCVRACGRFLLRMSEVSCKQSLAAWIKYRDTQFETLRLIQHDLKKAFSRKIVTYVRYSVSGRHTTFA